MKVFTAAISATLLASTAIAGRSRLQSRVDARIAAGLGQRSSHPLQAVGEASVNVAGNITQVQYSSNWAGAVRETPPSPSATYTAVSATFKVPQPTATGNASSNTYQAASAWIGIDGDTYTQAILQTGVDFYIYQGQQHYDAWYEWYPDYAYDFNLAVSAGDVVVARVMSTSPSQGVAVIENKSTGQSTTTTLTAPQPTATLGGQNAEWIVEDFESNGQQVAFVDFGQINFSGAEAKAGGKSYGVGDATLIDIKQNGQVLTDVITLGNHDLLVEYAG